MIIRIKQNVFQFNFQTFGSTVYLIKLANQNIIIDTSSKENKQELLADLKELNIAPEDIVILILTHSHWDHVGNNDLFKNAKIITNKNLDKLPKELKPIQTPGHTQDSVCIIYKDILFSGDTIFHEGGRGRTDLPEGNEKQIFESIEKLKKVKYKTLCPGHIN
ncbi:MAG: MBL fold metallo-hydrolase [Nanoarchaeota archaeon]|nr:MBL fold metallo-hydrolase [Nanoarchaeota archaeon]